MNGSRILGRKKGVAVGFKSRPTIRLTNPLVVVSVTFRGWSCSRLNVCFPFSLAASLLTLPFGVFCCFQLTSFRRTVLPSIAPCTKPWWNGISQVSDIGSSVPLFSSSKHLTVCCTPVVQSRDIGYWPTCVHLRAPPFRVTHPFFSWTSSSSCLELVQLPLSAATMEIQPEALVFVKEKVCNRSTSGQKPKLTAGTDEINRTR
ncbi:hypothetical protein B0H65DRAFT_142790 [Neurospora tetraspora]|uniref:Uncharacterized protein n=1 Tax=Neurospora tetraspora TaxID=94610 RepID=A0AAE0JMK9_9PEZI|nr:hypothetical protein B0H65DRAFT_142790 [Neurospora tetraspora]